MNSFLPPQLGYVIECNGAWLRAQAVGVAMRLQVSGTVDAVNGCKLAENLRRFVKLGAPLIVDFLEARLSDDDSADIFVDLHKSCASADVEWSVIADTETRALLQSRPSTIGLPITESVAEAAQHLSDAVRRRQRQRPTAILLSRASQGFQSDASTVAEPASSPTH
jgi:anti-anti-sigma regulatory factor